MSRNLAILVGNVGADPEYKHTENGAVANFSLATTDTWTDKQGVKQKESTWHKVVVWNQRADFVSKYVRKGDPLYVEGSIQNRTYDDKNGEKRYVTEIKARSVQKLGPKREDDGNTGNY